MQRLKDYGRLGLWCMGLGYIAFALAGEAETLPPAAQLVGVLAAVAALVQLLLIARRHALGRNAEPPFKLRRRPPDPTVMRIKARNHFGLRGVDR